MLTVPSSGLELDIPVFGSLDSLLAESLQQVEDRKKEKEMRKSVARGNLPASEIAETTALLRKWDDQREWRRTKNVLCFTRQLCLNCGAYHTTFEGYFERSESKRLNNTKKDVAVKIFELDLPKEVMYHDSQVPVCHECADQLGWELEEE